jgi:hypothetical protein
MKELWTGRVELLTPATEFGDTKCITNVFVWAESPNDFAVAIAQNLRSESVSVLQIEECHRVADDERFPEETKPFLDWARANPGEFTTADRHYYPSRAS